MNLFEEPVEIIDGKPILMGIQTSFLDRGRSLYGHGVLRAIYQAPCGSGKTYVAAAQTQKCLANGGTILHIVHRRRLVDQMMGVIRKFDMHPTAIMQGRLRWGSPVMCASRDTLISVLDAGAELPKPTLIIWDECHIAAQRLQSWYLNNHPGAYWTGYTATPVRSDGESLNPPYQALVSMAPTSEMLRLGRLCPVKVYNPDAIGRRRKKGDTVKPVGDPVEHWRKYACGLPTVAYAANVADSLTLCQRYNESGIPAEHMDANTEDDDRDAIFERSRTGKTLVICNCGVLIEGVDLPWLVCCQILRGCNSLVLWFQATGRVMRFFENKTHGIVLDHAGAAHEYGMPDADYHWALGSEARNRQNNKVPKEGKPVTCLKCGFVFAGKPACPECGHVLPKKKRKSLMDGIKPGDGILTEFTGAQDGYVVADMHERLFKKCYFIAKAKGKTMKMVAGMFSKETGIPPWHANLSLNIPGYGEWDTPAKDWRL